MFFSSDWALLTLIAECFMVYLHPLQWQHTFVPILSAQMLDFIMAPTSFLMGCHLDHFEEVSKVRYRGSDSEGEVLGRPLRESWEASFESVSGCTGQGSVPASRKRKQAGRGGARL